MNRKIAIAQWVKNDIAEIKQAAAEVQQKIDWIQLFGGIVLAIAVGVFMALPWITQ